MPTADELYAFFASLPQPKPKDESQVKATEMLAQNRARGAASGQPVTANNYFGSGLESLRQVPKDVYQGAVETFGPEAAVRAREAPIPAAAEAGPLGRTIVGPALRAGYSLASSPAATMAGEIGAATGFTSPVPKPVGNLPVPVMRRRSPEISPSKATEREVMPYDKSSGPAEFDRRNITQPPRIEGATPASSPATASVEKMTAGLGRSGAPAPQPLGAQASGQRAPQGGFPSALSAPVNKNQAAQLAAQLPPGQVNRDVLRPLENVFHRLQGKHDAGRTEVVRDLLPLKANGLLNSEIAENLYRHNEGDPHFGGPGAVLTPEMQKIQDTLIQPWRARELKAWEDVKRLRRGANLPPDQLDQLEFLNPSWMHRRTIKSVERLLGRGEEDPTSGIRLGVGKAVSEHGRKLFALVSEKDGSRHLGYLDINRNLYRLSKSYPDGALIATRQQFEQKGFSPSLGSRIQLRGQNYRLADAYTREIEAMTSLRYAKDAFVTTRLNAMELERVRDSLLAQKEVKQFLLDNRIASETRHANWVKADNYPGLSGLYVPPRISAVLERFGPYVREGDDIYDQLRRGTRALVHSLFWNPFIHGGNVSAHAFIQRGLRNFNPVANIKYLGHFARAWKDVASSSDDYLTSLRNGARLMYGPSRIAQFDRMNGLMFSGIKELQETGQGKGLLAQLQKATGIPPLSFIKAYYRWAGDALWAGGDVLLQAAIREERANLSGVRANETLAQTIARIHKEIPSYRIPTEELLGGKPGQMISQFMRHPATNAVVLFMPYHENVMRGMAMQAEDIMRGFTRIKSPGARKDAIDALGKIIATATAIGWAYPNVIDPAARKMFGDDKEGKRFGPFSPLQLALDYFTGKHLSPGASVRLSTGGFYSPSPLLEVPFNLSGAHSYSLTALQPSEPPFRRASDWSSVPWQERVTAALAGTTPVAGQIMDLAKQGMPNLPVFAGLASYSRKTPEGRLAEKQKQVRDPAYRAMVKRNKEQRGQKKRNPLYHPWSNP